MKTDSLFIASGVFFLAHLTSFSAQALPGSGPQNSFARVDCNSFQQAVSKGSADQQLKKIMDVYWKYQMQESPEWATSAGYPGYDQLWTDWSTHAQKRRELEIQCQKTVLQKINAKKLSEENRISYQLLVKQVNDGIESYSFDGQYLMLNHLMGVHIDIPDTLSGMATRTEADYNNILRRLENSTVLIKQTQSLLQEGLNKKITPVQMFMKRVPAQMDSVMTADVTKSPLYASFENIPENWPEERKQFYRTEAARIISEKVYPELKKLKEFLVKTYIPQSRTEISMSSLPKGKDWYAYMVRTHTTTNLSPESLHQLGLNEVERITNEMKSLLAKMNYDGSLSEFNRKLLSDSKYYYTDIKDLLTAYRETAKRIDAGLPNLFLVLPRNSYGVREMPSYKAKNAPTAYYIQGSLTAGRAGFFEANTYDLKARPKWGIEVLTLHEAVPGHHLQISLAQELEDVPEFRKNSSYTSYIEGWGLYAESLGAELGMYKDLESLYGAYVYELWRAVRLVVDTGMHYYGWSREKALDYFESLLPKSEIEAEAEVDRYITWPGQALAYKVGQLKILELRKLSESELGKRFSLREFHNEVLRHGAMPMDTLESSIKNWITQVKKITGKVSEKTAEKNN